MRPGREIDTKIAKEVFGYEVWATKKVLYERTPLGKRPLRKYSSQMESAWEVVEKVKITLLPTQGNLWLALAAGGKCWENPAEFVEYLQAGDFKKCGAAESENPAFAICQAALTAIQKQKASELSQVSPNGSDTIQ
jgi:hypothetical protein